MVKVLSRLRYLLLTMALMGLLWAMLVWLNGTHQDIGAQARATNVARLVDAHTALFVHVPDLNAARNNFGDADFTKLGIHHGMSAIAKQILRDAPELIHLSKHWEQCESMNITDATLTVTPEADRLTVLTLFRSENDPEALWESCMAWWKAESESIQEHIEERDGVRYRHLTGIGRTLVQSSWGGWHFASNDQAMLKRAMTRLRTGTPANALSEHEVFQQSLVPLQSDYLSLCYISQSEGDISSQASKARQRFGKIQRNLDRFHARSTAFTTTVRRGHMIEEAFVLTESPPLEEEAASVSSSIAEATLPLTSPQTLAYATANVGSPRVRRFLLERFIKRWKGAQVPALQEVAANWEAHFTNTWSLQLEPIETLSTTETEPESEPLATLLAFVLNDEAKIKAQLETLAQTEGSGISAIFFANVCARSRPLAFRPDQSPRRSASSRRARSSHRRRSRPRDPSGLPAAGTWIKTCENAPISSNSSAPFRNLKLDYHSSIPNACSCAEAKHCSILSSSPRFGWGSEVKRIWK